MSLYNWQQGAGGPSPAEQLNPSPVPRIQSAAPAAEPVTAAELALILKVSAGDEGELLTALLTAARVWAEAWTGRFFMTRTATLWLDFFPPQNQIEINACPVSAISGVSTFDEDDTETAMSASTDYRTDLVGEPARVVLRLGVNSPSGMRNVNAVKVAFTAGYADAASVPENIKTAIRLIAAEVYLGRGAQVDARIFMENYLAPNDALLLLQPYKVIR